MPLFIYYLGKNTTLLLLTLLLLLTILTSITYKKQIHTPILYQLIDKLERPTVKKTSPAQGAIYYIIGIILSLLLFTTPIALTCIIATSLGDAASTIIGKNHGAHKIPYNTHKSIEGSTACLIFATIGATTQISPILAIIAGITSTITESLPLPLNDNLSIPLSIGITLTIITTII
jgi:dolichol kinase